jgi:hypothetical protein
MGNGRDFYLGVRKGSDSEYVAISEAKIVNGVKGKVIAERKGKKDHTNLPKYSGTSDMYFRRNNNGIIQARLYIGNKKVLDFDWGHEHSNKEDNRKFPIGTVHVQLWVDKGNGDFSRQSNDARYMNNEEMKKYGPLIKAFNPNVKFR